jgi:hypothetical protein
MPSAPAACGTWTKPSCRSSSADLAVKCGPGFYVSAKSCARLRQLTLWLNQREDALDGGTKSSTPAMTPPQQRWTRPCSLPGKIDSLLMVERCSVRGPAQVRAVRRTRCGRLGAAAMTHCCDVSIQVHESEAGRMHALDGAAALPHPLFVTQRPPWSLAIALQHQAHLHHAAQAPMLRVGPAGAGGMQPPAAATPGAAAMSNSARTFSTDVFDMDLGGGGGQAGAAGSTPGAMADGGPFKRTSRPSAAAVLAVLSNMGARTLRYGATPCGGSQAARLRVTCAPARITVTATHRMCYCLHPSQRP